nr:hypothetical protein [Tanacetum cinerariifolium]
MFDACPPLTLLDGYDLRERTRRSRKLRVFRNVRGICSLGPVTAVSTTATSPRLGDMMTYSMDWPDPYTIMGFVADNGPRPTITASWTYRFNLVSSSVRVGIYTRALRLRITRIFHMELRGVTYGDYQMGKVMISRVYYVEGLGHNLFSVGQFCDSDLEDEVPEFVIKFLKMIQVRLNATVRNIQTDNGIEFTNQTLRAYYEDIEISYQTSVSRSSQQNDVVERRNRTLMEATRTINDSEDLDKLKPKADTGIFVGYATAKKAVASPIPAFAAQVPANSTGSPSLTPVDQHAPSPSTSQTPQASQSPVDSPGVVEDFHDIEVSHLDNDPFFGVLIPELNSEESSLRDVISTNVNLVNQPPEHLSKWTKDHPLDNVIGNPSWPVFTRHQLQNKSMFCYFDAFLSSAEPKNFKEALKESCWIEAIQEELNEFERLEVWELVPRPDRLLAREYRQEEGIDFEESFALVARLEAIIIMGYFMKISKKARILELKRKHLKITVLTSNTLLSRIDNDLFTYEIKVPKPTACDEQETSNPTRNDFGKYEWKMSYDECEKIYAEAVIFINKRLVRLIDVIMEQWLDLRYGNHVTMNKDVKKGDIQRTKTYEDYENKLKNEDDELEEP